LVHGCARFKGWRCAPAARCAAEGLDPNARADIGLSFYDPSRRREEEAVIRLGELIMFLDPPREGLTVLAIAGRVEIVHKTVRKYNGRCIIFFRWSGFDEGGRISGERSVELQDDGSI